MLESPPSTMMPESPAAAPPIRRVHARSAVAPLALTTRLASTTTPAVTEKSATFACVTSLSLHAFLFTTAVLGALVWNLWLGETLFPPGSTAGGRAAGTNASGIINVAPGLQRADDGEDEESGGVFTLTAPRQVGNQASDQPEVAGEVLEAKRVAVTQATTVTPPSNEPPKPEPPVETTALLNEVSAPVVERRPTQPPPQTVAQLTPVNSIQRRAATLSVDAELIAPTLPMTTDETPDAELAPTTVARQVTERQPAIEPAPMPAVSFNAPQPQTKVPELSTVTMQRGDTERPADDTSLAPAAANDSGGLARRAGTSLAASSTTKVEIDIPGAGGGAGGPGGTGGPGGPGGRVSDGPGGADVGQTHGSGGDLRSLLIFAPEPIYPRSLADAHVAGRVAVRVQVNAGGDIVAIKLHTSSGYEAFDRSALESIARWKFAKLSDKPWRGSVFIVPVRFKIQE